jgi:alkylhydroperoxidase family enzyme
MLRGASRDVVATGRHDYDGGDEHVFAVGRVSSITRELPSSGATARLAKAGYTPAQALAVLLGVATKTLSNYINHTAQTPIDPQFLPT